MIRSDALLPILVMLPLSLALLLLLSGRWGRFLSLAGMVLTTALAALLLSHGGQPLHHAMGGWPAPLGIGLRADGLATLMVMMTALVCSAALIYGEYWFDGAKAEQGRQFRPLAWLLWAGVNALLLADDLFNLYVTLELLTLLAAGLAALMATQAALTAALRYLMVALIASTAFLLGVALLYGATGTLALELISIRVAANPQPVLVVAMALMVGGLALKAALFPLHGWLPPAHGGAAPPVSALLSALVVKASFYVVLRLWMGPLAPLTGGVGPVLGVLGGMAIVWGGWQALRQHNLKMVVAYSTVAQMGYLFLAFDLLQGAGYASALNGMVLQAVAHGLAKGAMFLAAGALVVAAGGYRVDQLQGMASRQPLAVTALAVAGISLAGMPPTAGFAGKWLLLQAAWLNGQWLWLAVMLAGSLLTASYLLKVVAVTFLPAPVAASVGCGQRLGGVALMLALLALLAGFAVMPMLQLLAPVATTGGWL
ncbi:MAG: hypothetical protein II007_00515 [Gammaproteobacteria bacterium]|nr:hypothetical protein [Gammaproteobacteria bacterium]